MQRDRFGQILTTASASAAADYAAAVDTLFTLQPGAGSHIDGALASDPEMALAHSVKARSLYFEGRAADARSSAERGLALAANATPREQQHAAIVAMVTRGQTVDALELVRVHAGEYPRDAMPLSFALGVYGLLGFGGFKDYHRQQHELLQSVAHAWDDDWWFLAGYGWSCVETGDVSRGVDMLDRSLEIRQDNAQAAHARAHGFYECGAIEAGQVFIRDWLPGYSSAAPLHGHLSWHLALFLLHEGDAEGALDVYRDTIGPGGSQALPLFTMIDSAALLWRLRLQGHSVPGTFEAELLSFTRDHFPLAGLPFVNLHAALVYAGSGDTRALSTLAHEVTELVAAGQQNCGDVITCLCSAIVAYSGGDFAEAAQRLQEAVAGLERIGGSHAQRDVVIDTLVSAMLRSGNTDAAREIMQRRADVRAGHLDASWLARLRSR